MFLVYNILETTEEPVYGLPLVAALLAYAGLFSYVYLNHVNNPVFHQLVYGSTVVTLVAYSVYRWKKDPVIRDPVPDWNGSPREGTGRIQLIGYTLYLTGFLLWNLDNMYCEGLRLARITGVTLLGTFLGKWLLNPVLQLHGHWHLLTGFASYVLFTAQVYMQMLRRNRFDVRLDWQLGWFPVVVSVPRIAKVE
ncbi:Alkaline ceramidase 3 [Gonapodya sp. JEL0774]|nr:Alkaline ceramidase 3 [Gonapodya sp. JEL0774]